MSPWPMRSAAGRPSQYKTWLSVWLEANGLSGEEFAKIVLVEPESVDRWRVGGIIGSKSARTILAFFPDAPVYKRGGFVPTIAEPLPLQSRTKEVYKCILKISGVVEDRIDADALSRARGL